MDGKKLKNFMAAKLVKNKRWKTFSFYEYEVFLEHIE